MCERNTVQRRGFIRDGVWRTNQKNRSVSRAWYDLYTGTREAQRRDARIRCDSAVVVDALKQRGENLSKFPLLCHIYDMITKNITVDVPWKRFEK